MEYFHGIINWNIYCAKLIR